MKILLVGDLHFGEKGNSEKYNNQLLALIQWLGDTFGDSVDHVVQLGDFFHHRKKIQVDSMGYAIEGAKLLGELFGRENVTVLMSNHDIFHLNTREVSSLKAIEPYVTVVNDIAELDETTILCPWVVNEEEWNTIVDSSSKYRFCLGHFELNGFMVNDAYEMEHGFSPTGLKNYERVISGHYHSPQEKGNIVYAGTPLPITMNEANETHGVYVLDTDTGDLEFFEYETVRVVSVAYDQLDEKIKELDPENTSIRVEFPDDLEDESIIQEVRDILSELQFTDVKTKFKSQKAIKLLNSDIEIESVENIDATVLEFLSSDDEAFSGIDNELMKMWYNTAIQRAIGDQE